MATNLQEAARRMYSAKGFTDYGKILGAGLKEAVRDIAIAREQEEKEAKAERKQRDAFALDLYAKRPSINEGAVPPEMLSVVKNWLLDTRNQYNEATQNLSGDISDPSYRAAIDVANKTKTSYANLSSQMQMFKENQKEYLETVATTGFSNSNNQTDINLVSSIYNKDFSNFTIDDNGKVVLETKQGIKTLDEVNELFESLNAKAIKQTQGISAAVNESKVNGVRGIPRSQSDIDSTYAGLGSLFADKKNTLSYAFDTPGVKEFISNKFKLEDGSFTDEKMDLADKKDGTINDEWLRNPENYDLVYDAVIEHAADLVQRGNEEGIKIYNAKKDEGKPGELDYSGISNTIDSIRKASFKTVQIGAQAGGTARTTEIFDVERFTRGLQDEYGLDTKKDILTIAEALDRIKQKQLKNKQSQTAIDYKDAETDDEKEKLDNQFIENFKQRYPDAKFFVAEGSKIVPYDGDINDNDAVGRFLARKNAINKVSLYTK
jgi:hypothetical protein